MKTHIAIVGAGIAGLAAARALNGVGIAVTVFDRGAVPGGRCCSRRAGGGVFDHGAPFFTARDQRFQHAVAALLEQGAAGIWRGTVVDIDPAGMRPRAPATRYVGLPSMQHTAFAFAHGIEVVNATRVAHARRSARGWRLFDGERSELGDYDALVLALPPEQAQELVPPGTPLRLELMKARSLACWTLMLSFTERLPLAYDGAVIEGADLTWLARDSSKPGRLPGERWVAHAAASWSHPRLQHDPADVAAELVATFAAIVGLDDLQPMYSEAHRWRFARAARVDSPGALWDAELKLALCGDWCISPRLEDAYLSGLDTAATLTAHLLPRSGTVPA